MAGTDEDLDALRVTLDATRGALVAQRAALDRLEGRLQATLQALSPPPDAPHTDPSASEHRRLHRPGRPAKLDTDPELRAFVEARLDTMTFSQIAAAVAARFPPDRIVRRSAIHHWWRKTRRG